MSVRPFPWAALHSLSRAEADALTAMRAWTVERARIDDVARALGALVDARVDVMARRAGPARATTVDAGVAVVLAPADDLRLARGVVIEAEGALAAALVARAVRRAPAAIVDAARTETASLAGAFAAIVAATARRVHAGAPLRVLAAGPAAAIVRDVARADPELAAVELTVVVDDDAYLARVLLPRGAAIASPTPRWSAERLAAMGDARIAIPIVACASAAAAAEVASLARGDAWVPGAWPLARGASGAWTGTVALAAPSHDVGVVADLGEDGRLVLRGESTSLAWDSGETMNDSKEAASTLVDAVGEVPVVVRVEIGTAQMRAREWAALRRGDVVSLGRKIAEPVLLRVGDVAIARGELVEVDGEVAVRIVDRIESKEST